MLGIDKKNKTTKTEQEGLTLDVFAALAWRQSRRDDGPEEIVAPEDRPSEESA